MAQAQDKTHMTLGDRAIWAVVVVAMAALLIGNEHYVSIDIAWRLVFSAAVVLLLALAARQTAHGKRFSEFAREARYELRKVVWPSREEATKNTLLIAIIVVVMSGIIWALDALFSWMIAWLMG